MHLIFLLGCSNSQHALDGTQGLPPSSKLAFLQDFLSITLPLHKSGICKSSLELLSPHLSRACTFPSPTGFAYWVSGDFDCFPPLHQHLHSLSYHHLSSELARDSLHLISNLVLFFSHSFFTPQALWTTDSAVHQCAILLHAVATLVVLIPRDKPHSPCLLLLPPPTTTTKQGLYPRSSWSWDSSPPVHISIHNCLVTSYLFLSLSSNIISSNLGHVPLLDVHMELCSGYMYLRFVITLLYLVHSPS